mmetsp:Transcript_7339/g.10819  ORF Transcript_7339/g.10819 Transcript_7339/m.10819 type:complete len:117 (+) Transcript_7339:237-587(+)
MVREITEKELNEHGETADEKWIAIDGIVANVNDYLDEHPGGDDIILENCGRDATSAFEGVGHSEKAYENLRKLQIGKLKGYVRKESSVEGGSNAALYVVGLLLLVGAGVYVKKNFL